MSNVLTGKGNNNTKIVFLFLENASTPLRLMSLWGHDQNTTFPSIPVLFIHIISVHVCQTCLHFRSIIKCKKDWVSLHTSKEAIEKHEFIFVLFLQKYILIVNLQNSSSLFITKHTILTLKEHNGVKDNCF